MDKVALGTDDRRVIVYESKNKKFRLVKTYIYGYNAT
jgi:hypothetical protein